MYVSIKDRGGKDTDQKSQGANVSATLIMGMGCQQCLLLSVVQLKGNHCPKPHCRNGMVGTFGQGLVVEYLINNGWEGKTYFQGFSANASKNETKPYMK